MSSLIPVKPAQGSRELCLFQICTGHQKEDPGHATPTLARAGGNAYRLVLTGTGTTTATVATVARATTARTLVALLRTHVSLIHA